MESIEELKKICQGTIHKDVSNVYMRYVCRPLSIHFTRMLLPTAVTADQVSQAMIASGFLAVFVLSFPAKAAFMVGAILLQVWYLIDSMDGEVARYRYYQKTGRISIDKRDASLTGMYYDMINHYLMNFLVPVAVAFGQFAKTGSWLVLWAGTAASLGQVLLLAMHDARCRAVLSHLKKYSAIRVIPSGLKNEKVSQPFNLAKFTFSALHYSMTYPTVMNLVLVAAFLDYFVPQTDWRNGLLIFLSAGSVIVSTVLIVRAIRLRVPDQEFTSEFSVLDQPANS